MEDMILRMEIPVETVKEVSESGEAKEVERKVFPGYVLIKMVMTDDTLSLIHIFNFLIWTKDWRSV